MGFRLFLQRRAPAIALLTLLVAGLAPAQVAINLGPAIVRALVLTGLPQSGSLNWRPSSQFGGGRVFQAEFQSSVVTEFPANNTVPLWLFEPANMPAKTPLVVVLHYLGALDLEPEFGMASRLNRQGIAALVLALPYHLSRTPDGYRSGQLAIQPDISKLETYLVQADSDVRNALTYALSRSEFQGSPVGITGISLGSLIAETVFGVDNRIDNAAFILGGCDIARIMWTSTAVGSQKLALKRRGYTLNRLETLLRPIEPSTFLARRFGNPPSGPSNAFVVAAKFDTVIPAQASAALISSLPHPEVLWLDTGHYGGAFVQARLEDEVAKYFAQTFSGRPYVPPAKISAPTLRLAVQAMSSLGFDIGLGIDLFRSDGANPIFASFVATPRGAEIFFGRQLGQGISIGAVGGTRGVGIGVFWSAVL